MILFRELYGQCDIILHGVQCYNSNPAMNLNYQDLIALKDWLWPASLYGLRVDGLILSAYVYASLPTPE